MRIFIFSLTCLFLSFSPLRDSSQADKILLLQVDETGQVTIGRDVVSADILARYVQERLFKSFMGTGQMHDRIRLEKTDSDIPLLVLETIIQEIREGQKRALRELCMQKYSRYFESLDSKKQDRLRKQFPVLFQSDFLE
ncbi:MAG: hypothetical protein ACO25B_03960 [Chitinophagaceae bacterium]